MPSDSIAAERPAADSPYDLAFRTMLQEASESSDPRVHELALQVIRLRVLKNLIDTPYPSIEELLGW